MKKFKGGNIIVHNDYIVVVSYRRSQLSNYSTTETKFHFFSITLSLPLADTKFIYVATCVSPAPELTTLFDELHEIILLEATATFEVYRTFNQCIDIGQAASVSESCH
jgi:hypothetical protein